MEEEFKDPKVRYKVLRRCQFIAPFGVGSIVDLPDESVMPAAIDLWHENAGIKIKDIRLQKRLNCNYFKMVPSDEEFKQGIPFYRFPKWLFCPKCRSLRHIKEWRMRLNNAYEGKIPRCDICKVKLVPSRFVVACEKGHIDDFPYLKWVHAKKGDICANPDLEIATGGSNSGLIGIQIKCKNCGESATMAKAFNKDAHSELAKIFPNIINNQGCTGYKPWIDKYDMCDLVPRTLQRGASNVYFPKIVNSIVIPPYSDNIIAEVQETDGYNLLISQDGGIDDNTKKDIIKMIATTLNRDFFEIKSVFDKLDNKAKGLKDQSEINYRYDEFRAFHGAVDEGSIDSNDFKIEIRDGSEYKIPGIDKIVLVHRLREVRSLVAFSRIKPLDRNEYPDDEIIENQEVHGVSVKENKNIKWLPAYEVRGEGIFISFKPTLFSNKNELEKRAKRLNNRYNNRDFSATQEPRHITAKFLFLHTLAHILIRQLSFDCGYSSASLRERIYCNETDEQPLMSGMLIYTASGDSEGTLGGLVRQGKPEHLNKIVIKAVQNAAWCSSDPLCSESLGQGLDSLNLAACHACVLLPETSCEEMNRLLDRVMIVGTPEKPNIGILSTLLNI